MTNLSAETSETFRPESFSHLHLYFYFLYRDKAAVSIFHSVGSITVTFGWETDKTGLGTGFIE